MKQIDKYINGNGKLTKKGIELIATISGVAFFIGIWLFNIVNPNFEQGFSNFLISLVKLFALSLCTAISCYIVIYLSYRLNKYITKQQK